jgi:NADP-dependent 3-hydroxy acid dehydrogenase YdfG
MVRRLEGKIAVVTGGTTGIGLASSDAGFIAGTELFVDGGQAQI